MLRSNPAQAPRLGRWCTVTVALLTAAAWTAIAGVGDLRSAADDPKTNAQDKGKADLNGDALPPGALARMGSLRWRHGDAVTFVAYAADGKGVLTVSRDRIIRLWDRETGKEIRRFTVPVDPKPAPPAIQPAPRVGFGGGLAVSQSMVAVSPDGKVLAALAGSGIHLWDIATGKEIRTLKAPAAGVSTLLFSPNGKILAARGADRTIYLLDTDSGNELRQIKGPQQQMQPGVIVLNGRGGPSGGLAFSPDGKTLASGETEFVQPNQTSYVRFCEVDTGKEIRRIDAQPDGVSGIAYSPRGNMLAIGRGTTVHLHEADSAKEIRQIKTKGAVAAVVFAPDGKTLATKARDQVLRLWKTDTGEEIRQFGEPVSPNLGGNAVVFIGGPGAPEPRDFAFSADWKELALGGNYALRLFTVESGKEIPVANGHRGPVWDLAIVADGKTLISRGADTFIRRWNFATGAELGQFAAPPGTTCVAFAPDGQTVAVGFRDTAIRVYDAVTGKLVRELTGHPNGTAFLTFSPDGKLLASRGGSDNTIRLYNVAKGTDLRQILLPGDKAVGRGGAIVMRGGAASGVTLAFSPDGQTVAANLPVSFGPAGIQPQPAAGVTSDTIRLWDVSTGKEIRRLSLPQKGLKSFAFSPDGRVLATENSDQSISLWEIASAKERVRLVGPPANALPPRDVPMAGGGFVLATGGGNSSSAAVTLAYSPDGTLLACRGPGNAVRVWDVLAGKEIGSFKGHDGAIQAIVFAPDGKSLASGSNDTTILVWDVASLQRAAKPAPVVLQPMDLETLWNDLAGDDASKAFQGILTLAAASKQSVAFLRGQLQPAALVDPKKLDALIADLDHDNFQTRNKATKELDQLGELAVPAMQKILSSKPSLETAKRLETLLEKLVGAPFTTDRVRLVRAVEVLERVGTPEARQVLETLARGAPGALSTRQAKAALDRITR